MKKIFIPLFLLLNFSICPQQADKFINVTGNSEIIKKADQLKFTVQIRTTAETVEQSKILNDKALVDLYIILRNVNIPSEDIETSPISFGKHYESGDRGMVHNGYFTNMTLSFLLQDLKRYYDITNRLSANDAFEINAGYMISDYELQHREAYEKALAAAKEKALYMSAALGMKVGDVLEIEELNNQGFYPNPMNTITRETGGDNIAGNVSIRRSVRVKFSISPR